VAVEAASVAVEAAVSPAEVHRDHGETGRDMVRHAMKRKDAANWWLSQKATVARAVDDAERASGHQIVVAVGKLGRRPDIAANRVARKHKGATLVFCVDPLDRRFELRWSATVSLSEEVIKQTSALLAGERLAEAIALVAASLPVQAEGDELPDIVEE
jgi:hypothetical protein